jgi:hypothetical protein
MYMSGSSHLVVLKLKDHQNHQSDILFDDGELPEKEQDTHTVRWLHWAPHVPCAWSEGRIGIMRMVFCVSLKLQIEDSAESNESLYASKVVLSSGIER